MYTLTVIVPFWNESRTIPALVHQLQSIDDLVKFDYIFVNDGSQDESLELLLECLKPTDLRFRVIDQDNTGKAGALKAASRLLNTTHCVIIDSDLELDVRAMLPAWEIINSKSYEAVVGYRNFLSHSSFTYRYSKGNQFLSNFYGLLFNSVITDLMCGFKMIPSEILRTLPFALSRFSIEVEIICHLWRTNITPFELQVEYKPRNRHEGKTIGVRDAFKVILGLIWLRARLRRGET